jgi:hypothetical protein
MKLALTYFADADQLELPIDHSVAWKQVKVDLQRGVQQWDGAETEGLSGSC